MTAAQPCGPGSNHVENPILTIISGQPTAEELAALTAVVLSLQPVAETEAVRHSTRHWVRREQLRLGPKPGPGAWRRSRG